MLQQSSRSLPEQFPFDSQDLIWRQLRQLVHVLEGRFQEIERETETYEEEVEKFEALGLAAVNEALVPLVDQAIARLASVATIFSAISQTPLTVDVGPKQLVIPGEDRLTFAPTSYVTLSAIDQDPYVGMIAQVLSFESVTGEMNVDAQFVEPSQSPPLEFANWLVQASGPPSVSAVSLGQVDAAQANAEAYADEGDDATLATIRGGVITAFDTLNKLATALGNNPNFLAEVYTAIAAKAPLTSPALAGVPTAPTPTLEDSSTKIATTAFVKLQPTGAYVTATVSEVRQATVGQKALIAEHMATVPAPITLTDAATVTFNWTSGINFSLTLGGNRVLGNPTNGVPGTWRSILVIQQASPNNRTLTYSNQFVFPGGVAPLVAIGSNVVTRIMIFCRSSSLFEVYMIGSALA